jgi:hypothetical protein
MKDAQHRNQIEAKERGYGKALYTVSPKKGYLVNREYHPEMSAGDMTRVEQDIADRIDDYVKTNKTYIGTAQAPVDHSIRVIETHEMMKNPDAVHSSPSRVRATPPVIHVNQPSEQSCVDITRAQSKFNETLMDMEAEAS